jgi:hypothetical protein
MARQNPAALVEFGPYDKANFLDTLYFIQKFSLKYNTT